MKLSIERTPLANALAKINSIIEKRNTMPVLSHVLLTASGDTLTIKGTDLDIEATATVAATVHDEGTITVSAQMLTDIAKKAPSGALISMDMTDTGELAVSYGRSSFKLSTLPASEFPIMASEDYAAEFDVSGHDMHRLFGKTAFAMSNDETRYYLTGIYLHKADDTLTAVATDGSRLVRVTAGDVVDFTGVIVPRKTVAQIKSITDDVHVSVSETKIRFKSDAITIVSKVIDGTYPNYAAIIPTKYDDSLTVDAAAMRSAADRVATVIEETKARVVKLTIKADAIGISSRGGSAEATDEIDADVSGILTELGFNSKYMSDVLAACDGGRVTIAYTDKGGPAVFTPDDDEGFLALLMPWRI